MQKAIAQCNCGALRAVCGGSPARVSVCHCGACRRRTGSAFSWNATFPTGQVDIEGEYLSFRRVTDAGMRTQYNFCPQCGSTVFYLLQERPGMVSVPAGGFADTAGLWPETEVLPEQRQPWCCIPLDRPAMAAQNCKGAHDRD
jgi:hypothetical protein